MKTVILHEPPAPPETHEVEDVRAFLVARYSSWPGKARIYHEQVGDDHDVTPHDLAGVARLKTLPGPFHVVVYPASWESALWIAPPVAMNYYLFKAILPKAPGALNSPPPSSPSNQLSDRQNQARIKGRVPDILGQVRATFDLLGTPVRIWEENLCVEYAYLSVGRGEYLIEEVKDGTDLVSTIGGECVQFYGPNKSPLNASPDLTIPAGVAKFSEVPTVARRSNTVNGQKVIRPDIVFRFNEWGDYPQPSNMWAMPIDGTGLYSFKLDDASGRDLTQYYTNGQRIAPDPTGDDGAFGGTYTIDHVTPTRLYLVDAASVASAWATSTPHRMDTGSTIIGVDRNWIGPYFLDDPDATQAIVNLMAPSGLWYIDQDDGTTDHPQRSIDVTVEIEVVPTDAAGNDAGAATVYSTTMHGSAGLRNTIGVTVRVAAPGRCRVRVRNTHPRLGYDNQAHPWDDARFLTYQDDIKWTDLYSTAPVTLPHFGDVTTAMCRTAATREATSVKDRKLSALVTRRIRRRGVAPVAADGFSIPLFPTCRGDDIFCHVSLDPLIGNRSLGELDVDAIYRAVSEAETYFGTSKAIEFCATLDKEDLSYEETAATIAETVFCTASRTGSTIQLDFERETEDATLLFNHRNKVPGSEKRTYTFGNLNDNDGVEYTWVDPTDDSSATYYLPADRSSVNPSRMEGMGVRNRLQAHLHACRAWNRIQFQRIATEFEALEEANLARVGSRVLVADNTRPETQDGQVESQSGLVLTLSRDVVLDPATPYTVFLQLPDGSTQGIAVSSATAPNEIVLSQAPRIPLSTQPDAACRAGFTIVAADDPREKAFRVSEVEPQGRMTTTVRAVNDDPRVYANDLDYVNGVLTEDGLPTS